METDRPDQSETPFTVAPKYFQAELGVNKQNFKDHNYILTYPTALLKYGMNKRAEVGVEFNFITSHHQLIPNPVDTTGLEPISVGTKVSLLKEKGIIPQTAFIAFVGLPFAGSKKFKTPHLIPSFRFSMQHSLTNKISFGYNVGAEWDGESTIPEWLYTLVTGFEIGEKWQTFIEAYGFIAKNELPQHNVDGGIAYYINDDFKLDASAGFGLTHNALKNFLSLGASFRLPTKK
jgi:hypothetical protein